jgi:hypothetical protein
MSSSPGDEQTSSYFAHRDALEAAAQAAAANDAWAVSRYLSAAASAAARTLQLTGTVVAERESLEGDRPEVFMDTSASNPWTLVVGVYAALAAGDDAVLQDLYELRRFAFGSPQVAASPVAENFAQALVAAAVGRDEEGADHLRSARESAPSKPHGEPFWLAQVDAVESVLSRRAEEFRQALSRVAKEVQAFEASTGGPPTPEGRLELPVLGLEALARLHGPC